MRLPQAYCGALGVGDLLPSEFILPGIPMGTATFVSQVGLTTECTNLNVTPVAIATPAPWTSKSFPPDLPAGVCKSDQIRIDPGA